jgi:hypothetical protein
MELVCPHCGNALDPGERPLPKDIACPACGSTFRLESQTTTDWSGPDDRRTLGKYVLMDAVGSGAFGTVYKARDPDLDRVVAIKVPRSGNLAGKGELERFLREARSVAQLRHPFIVAVYEVGQAADVPYLVSEFVHGVTLADQLSARRPAPRPAAELIARLADDRRRDTFEVCWSLNSTVRPAQTTCRPGSSRSFFIQQRQKQHRAGVALPWSPTARVARDGCSKRRERSHERR